MTLIILAFFKFIFSIVLVLVSVAFVTLLERKILSIVGFRLGPYKVSMLGVLQPIGDAVKLANKQLNLLSNFSFFFYYLSSIFMMFSALILWVCFFNFPYVIVFKFSMLIFLLMLSFNSLNSIISGWSTFSKFSLIGSIRTVSQLISYESAIYLCLFFIFLIFYSFSFSSFTFYPVLSIFVFCPLVFYSWFPCFLAELNRTPYDFSEGESELVSGFNTEFGSVCFTLIFLAEYSNILFFCLISFFLFFWCSSFFFFFFLFFVIWIRSVLPRFRFDKLMMLVWKFFIPFLTLIFLLEFIYVF